MSNGKFSGQSSYLTNRDIAVVFAVMVFVAAGLLALLMWFVVGLAMGIL